MNFFTWLSSLFKPKPPPARPAIAEVIIATGLGDDIGSDGFKHLAQSVRDAGRTVEIVRFNNWQDVVARVVAAGVKRLILCGHSYGGGAMAKAARALRSHAVSVEWIFLLDPSEPNGRFPAITDNVANCIEWYCVPTTLALPPGPRALAEPGNTRTRFDRRPVALPIHHLNIDNNSDILRRIVEVLRAN